MKLVILTDKMEIVEANATRQNQLTLQPGAKCPCRPQCTRIYVQPPRVKSFAPRRAYNPTPNPIDANTTYQLSYLNVDSGQMHRIRSRPIRPIPALDTSVGKLSDETTAKMSYKPIWNIVKTKPVLPRRRPMTHSGVMENITTVRQDFTAKCIDRPAAITPYGNIRISTGKLDDQTTTTLSFGNPGSTERTSNFKPIRKYCPPSQPLVDGTTQRLSYQPFRVKQKETPPWAKKPSYKPPDTAMCVKTTYNQSFLENENASTEKPIIPVPTNILPYGAEFLGKTIYKESYLESNAEPVTPVIPSNNICVSGDKMSADTTNKLSYQPVRTEMRSPILPRRRNMMGDGPMQSATTSRLAFVPKVTLRPEPIVPCANLRTSEEPIDDGTTTRLSYVKPAAMECVRSFKPANQYQRSTDKIDGETVNKLSYQAWTPIPKEKLTWATKGRFVPSTEPMATDTVQRMSFVAPGQFIECGQCNCQDVPCEMNSNDIHKCEP